MSHDKMLEALRVLIAEAAKSATGADDVSALASLVLAYVAAVEHRPPS